MSRHIGVLTSGGDSPGLNAAIRAIGKTALDTGRMEVVGFRDGFRGLMENRLLRLERSMLSSILTLGGTILGTSRDKPHKMPVGGEMKDMTEVICDNYHRQNLDALICIGGGGTQKNAFRLAERGLNILTLPKTIDNDVYGTDVTFGFDTAMEIATEAIDRLHSTAHSHHRIIVVEVMGHNAGWLALGAGIASGADVILIPEIPYDREKIVQAIRQRQQRGKNFSIVVVAEGALSVNEKKTLDKLREDRAKAKESSAKSKSRKKAQDAYASFARQRSTHTLRLSQQLEEMTGLESRLTILGHLQRGGTPSATDRVLATKLGSACVRYIDEGIGGVMVAVRGDSTEPVPLKDVVNKRKVVPPDHSWIESARNVGTCLGD
ncbi:6-phosphofructokinase [Desulfofustis glycolicus]|uniref:ATP-dependent 6-phosphofructokinase n=1 Tax=Desulfofustis glycolicus DSM 9705 TaxID=1121409 RepID=A0A1M5YJX8_9BACT|nr:ATP-dependent 6-phosphofructokinase [Desulfofustis glycolicus]MCB2217950.1 6-phosphofructokinase [Desulfobulbaceae bacterium]SHI12341.1 6-phosphofructokinase 1 [Desulfofustis glycolicus DSM 9705]